MLNTESVCQVRHPLPAEGESSQPSLENSLKLLPDRKRILEGLSWYNTDEALRLYQSLIEPKTPAATIITEPIKTAFVEKPKTIFAKIQAVFGSHREWKKKDDKPVNFADFLTKLTGDPTIESSIPLVTGALKKHRGKKRKWGDSSVLNKLVSEIESKSILEREEGEREIFSLAAYYIGYQRNLTLTDNQLFGAWLLANGEPLTGQAGIEFYALDQGTGEGKTLTVLLAAIYETIIRPYDDNGSVFIAVRDDSFVLRDGRFAGEICEGFGIEVKQLENESVKKEDDWLSSGGSVIHYTTLARLGFDYIQAGKNKPLLFEKLRQSTLIADEIDHLLGDFALCPMVVHSPPITLKELTREIWNEFQLNIAEKILTISMLWFSYLGYQEPIHFIDKQKIANQAKTLVNFLENLKKTDNNGILSWGNRLTKQGLDNTLDFIQRSGLDRLVSPKYRMGREIRLPLETVIQMAFASLHFRENEHYVVGKADWRSQKRNDETRMVVPLDLNTGVRLVGHVFEGVQAFIEAREGITLSGFPGWGETIDRITVLALARMFKKVTGASGTASLFAPELWGFFGTKVHYLERTFPPDKTETITLIENEEKANEIVIREILDKQAVSKRRPLLCACLTDRSAKDIADKLTLNEIKVEQIIDSREENYKLNFAVEKAGRVGTVSVGTNRLARGADIVVSDDIANDGGGILYVIGAKDLRSFTQVKGRIGRFGQPGEIHSYIILSHFSPKEQAMLRNKQGKHLTDALAGIFIERDIERYKTFIVNAATDLFLERIRVRFHESKENPYLFRNQAHWSKFITEWDRLMLFCSGEDISPVDGIVKYQKRILHMIQRYLFINDKRFEDGLFTQFQH